MRFAISTEEKSLVPFGMEGFVAIVNVTLKSIFEFGKQKHTIITKEYPKRASKNDIPYYPINNKANNKRYSKYKKLAEKTNVIFGGRLAEYKYYDMHQVIGSALSKVKKEIKWKSV